MSVEFDRVVKITAYRQRPASGDSKFFEEIGNATVIEDLDVSFKIEKSLSAEPNTCEVIITNLAERSRSEFQRRPLRVHVEAGYRESGPRLLFLGDVQPGSGSRPDGADWRTKLLLGDGWRAFSEARVNRSYKTGTPTRTILRDVARSLGLELPEDVATQPFVQAGIPTGETAFGYASDELARLLGPFGYSFSIQNGRLQILKDEQARSDFFVIEEDNGMIDSPEMGAPDKSGKPPSLTVKHLLYPELVPGGKIEVRSRAINGRFKIVKTTHTGDTSGNEWETEVEANPL